MEIIGKIDEVLFDLKSNGKRNKVDTWINENKSYFSNLSEAKDGEQTEISFMVNSKTLKLLEDAMAPYSYKLNAFAKILAMYSLVCLCNKKQDRRVVQVVQQDKI